MMFEKSLKSIEDDPTNDEQLRAFLSLVGQLSSSSEKADALAHLAEVLFKSNVLVALEQIEAAFRLSPEHEKVLGVLTTFFEKRGSKDALQKVRSFARSKGIDSHEPPADLPRAAKREPTLATTPKPTKSLLVSREGSASEKPVAKKQEKPATPTHDLFNDFVKEAKLPYGVLGFAEEFADSLLGLIHFLSYLRRVRKITLSEFARSAEILLLLIDKAPNGLEAKARYHEIMKSDSRPPSARFRG